MEGSWSKQIKFNGVYVHNDYLNYLGIRRESNYGSRKTNKD